MTDISYVITVYNKAHHLEPVLAALGAQQGGFSREFIFVDDESTDEGPALIRAVTASWPNVKILSHANAGPAKATNTGIGVATGRFIKLLDADDILSPWATATLLDLAENAGCDAVYGTGRYFRTGERVVFAEPPRADLSILPDPLHYAIRSGLAGASHLLMRREVALSIGCCDEGVFEQDHSLALRLASRARIGLTDTLIWQGPQDDPKRLMKNTAQHMHDYNFALTRFLGEFPVDRRYRTLGARRAAGRAWNWAKRNLGRIEAMPWLFLKLQAEAGVESPALFEQTCLPFRRLSPLRVPALKSGNSSIDLVH